MADWHGTFRKGSQGGEEFHEEDLWSFANESEESFPQMRKSKVYSSGSSSAWRFHSASASAPRVVRRTKNTPTAAHEASKSKVAQQSSAPLNIPDWSKIYGKNANLGSASGIGSGADGVSSSNAIVYSNGVCKGYYDDDDDDDDHEEVDDDGNMVPPHEWSARKLARNQISSFSVYEGIGRTLKGRDLSKVRNAILTKTGFLE